MNNFRAYSKKTIIQGLSTDSPYSSDFEDAQRENREQNNPSNNINSINNPNHFAANEKIENIEEDQYEGCSEETIALLKTRSLFDNPIKRLLSIWQSLYT